MSLSSRLTSQQTVNHQQTVNQTIVQVDAFTDRPFCGNPAAVCVLAEAQPDDWMQQVAAEMNLSETAFLLPESDGYRLRWFTPTVEMDLCGHATLASAHVLWTEGHLAGDRQAKFYTRSGLLTADRQGDWIELDFPVNLSQKIDRPARLAEVLGVDVQEVYENSLGYLVEVTNEETVRQMQPDFGRLKDLPVHGIIVTSRGNAPYDFVSRFFAPAIGINEDPVTGAAHCCLVPYWCDRLQKTEFLAYQASARGGVVKARRSDNRVKLAGQAVTVMRGALV
ncbi:PhzF family phenazine biosynthesis protein [Leptolyngbya ohadii]|uniref:PhzF family phenazine biosynthesis protein n=1 Tax=Leptolyngbya ohadii TaxID=1962290 RepID=UPI000B599DC1|nr:PhzF family phenazine biosynthesis protein [Leptolyngbya ohadii]